MAESTAVERLWRCPQCGDEKPFDGVSSKAQRPRWCLGENGSHRAIPTPMSLVERERIYASPAEREIIERFEVSDWGLMAQAVRHYAANRKRTARRNPGADAVLARGVYPRFDALERACNYMRRFAQRDTENGGRIAEADWSASPALNQPRNRTEDAP